MARGVLGFSAHIQDADVGVVDGVDERVKVRDPIGAQFCAVDQGVNLADRGADEVIDTDADEFSSRVGDLVCVVADEGKGAPHW